MINRCEEIVDQHKVYEQKLANADSWLKNLEEHLSSLKTDEVTGNLEARNSRLQMLLSERDHAEHQLGALNAAGERILPDTSSQGREFVRQEIRRIRERWDSLAEGIVDQQKKQGLQSMQWSSYQETLQQILTWLDNMERTVKQEVSNVPSSLQEIRSKLHKCKVQFNIILLLFLFFFFSTIYKILN